MARKRNWQKGEGQEEKGEGERRGKETMPSN